MKLGITSGVFLNYSLPTAASKVVELGYDGVDIWSGRPHAYRKDYSSDELREIRKTIEDGGACVSSFLPAFHRYPYLLSSPNEVVRRDSVQYMRDCLESAVLLGSPILLVVPEKSLFDQDTSDARARLLQSIREICEFSEGYPIRLGLEPVNHFVSDMVNTAGDAMAVLAEIGHPALGIVLDTGHINLADESIEDAVAICGEHLLQVHVNDNDGIHQQNLIPGEGIFDFAHLLGVLQAAGFDGFLSAELGYHYTHDPVPASERTLDIMRGMLEIIR